VVDEKEELLNLYFFLMHIVARYNFDDCVLLPFWYRGGFFLKEIDFLRGLALAGGVVLFIVVEDNLD
jgi:hypothetical protein